MVTKQNKAHNIEILELNQLINKIIVKKVRNAFTDILTLHIICLIFRTFKCLWKKNLIICLEKSTLMLKWTKPPRGPNDSQTSPMIICRLQK